MDEDVRLVHQGELPPRTGSGPPERVPDDPLHAVRRVDADLGRDLVRAALADDPAVADVRALGALAHDDEVDLAIGARPCRQRRRDPGVEPGRPQVHVVVEGEPQPEQQPAFEHPARHARVADRAEQDGVVPAQLVEHAVGQRLAGRVPAPGTEVVVRRLELDVVRVGDGVEHPDGLGDDLGADAVAGDEREPQGGRGGGRRGHAQWPVSPPLSRRSMASCTACCTACFGSAAVVLGRWVRCVRVIVGSSEVRRVAGQRRIPRRGADPVREPRRGSEVRRCAA